MTNKPLLSCWEFYQPGLLRKLSPIRFQSENALISSHTDSSSKLVSFGPPARKVSTRPPVTSQDFTNRTCQYEVGKRCRKVFQRKKDSHCKDYIDNRKYILKSMIKRPREGIHKTFVENQLEVTSLSRINSFLAVTAHTLLTQHCAIPRE